MKESNIDFLLAGILVNRHEPLAPHHVSWIKEKLGYPTENELHEMIRTGRCPMPPVKEPKKEESTFDCILTRYIEQLTKSKGTNENKQTRRAIYTRHNVDKKVTWHLWGQMVGLAGTYLAAIIEDDNGNVLIVDADTLSFIDRD